MESLNATLARMLWISAAILDAGILLFTCIGLLFEDERTKLAAILLTGVKLACLPPAVAALGSLVAAFYARRSRPGVSRLVLIVALAFLWVPVLVVLRYRAV